MVHSTHGTFNMRLGYNTNGFAHHDLVQAIDVLAEIGYRSVAITLDHGALNPFSAGLPQQREAVRRCLSRHGMRSVIETGARYLLDPRVKHEPTLVSPREDDRRRRIEFLCRGIDVARELESDCVSLWSGVVRDSAADEEIWSRLIGGLRRVADYAAERGVVLGFEPEPGMFIDTMSRYAELLGRMGGHRLELTLDIGHLHCQREWPVTEQIEKWGAKTVNVHLEDMRAGVHEHLMFGEGELDFAAIRRSLVAARYGGGVHIELSRHSHDAPRAARESWQFLQSAGWQDLGE
jgi:sugar phosphate isomerase/epimerase